jgi:hypothetical protein
MFFDEARKVMLLPDAQFRLSGFLGFPTKMDFGAGFDAQISLWACVRRARKPWTEGAFAPLSL